MKQVIDEDPKKKIELLKYYDLVLDGLKTDKEGIPNPYIAVVLARDMVQFSLIVLLYDYPILQISSQLLSAIFLFIYVIKKKPFILKLQNILDMSREFFLGVVFIVVMTMQTEDPNQNAKGLAVIIMCCFIIASQFLGSVVLVLMNIYIAINNKRKNIITTKNFALQFKLGKRRIKRNKRSGTSAIGN